MVGVQRGDWRGKRAVGLVGLACSAWHEVEYRFAGIGIHEPGKVEYGRFCRLLLASLHEGLDSKGRANIDHALTPPDESRPIHPGAAQAFGLNASPEYQRIMTDPRSTPEQRANARLREIDRRRRRGGG